MPELKRVQVGRYAYDTDLPVKVGDKVKLPGTWVPGHEDGWEGEVTSLTSDYIGPCKRILGFVEEE
jgi:hypothetical protein